jgi:hypothetical protein
MCKVTGVLTAFKHSWVYPQRALCAPLCTFENLVNPAHQVIGSAFTRPDLVARTFTPPFVFRFGFGGIFAGGAYMLASGDTYNGTGVMTGTSLAFRIDS